MASSLAPTIDREPYEQTATRTERVVDIPAVTVEATTAVYEDPAFAERFAPAIPADIERSPRALFTTGLSFSRPPPGGKTTDRLLGIAARFAGREFERSLREDGLRHVSSVGSRDLRLRDCRSAKAFGYEGVYPLAGPARDAGHESVAVRVWAAIWPTTESFAMAGGIYPVESLAVPEADLAVEATPAGDRREVFDAIRGAAE